jgi:DNA-binding transcriptional regulator YiaG
LRYGRLLMPKPISSAKRRECVRLRVEQNLSTPQIARTVGVSNFSAYRILRKHPWRPVKGYGRRAWSERDDRDLRQLYPMATWEELQRRFPQRTLAAIAKEASELGLRRDSKMLRQRRHYLSPIVEALRAERLRRRMTGDQLADKMGYAVALIRRWETGINQPKLRQIEDWGDALGMMISVQPAKTAPFSIAPIDRARLMAGR